MTVVQMKYERKYRSIVGDIKPDLETKYSTGLDATLEEVQADGSIKTYVYVDDEWIEASTEGSIEVSSFPAVASSVLISPTGGSKTVAATGTGVPLVATSTKRTMLYVRAKSTNTGNIYFGDSAVDATTNKQLILTAGQSVSIDAPTGYCLDVGQYYIDADVNAEGVDFLYI